MLRALSRHQHRSRHHAIATLLARLVALGLRAAQQRRAADASGARRHHTDRQPDTEKLVGGERVRRLVNIEVVAMRTLALLNAATRLDDLRIPPGQHSIRINDQWRVCFVWTDTGPDAVEIVDYH